MLNEDVTELHPRYFIRKAANVAGRRGMRPSLAILVASQFEPAALSAGKSAGLIFTTPGILFGEDVGSALAELIAILSNAAAAVVSRPEVVDELFGRLGKIEGAAGNLRGPLFEMMVGYSVREVEGTSIDIGVQVVTNKGPAEIDVLRVKTKQEVWAYECKGILADKRITEADIDRWPGTTVPRICE